MTRNFLRAVSETASLNIKLDILNTASRPSCASTQYQYSTPRRDYKIAPYVPLYKILRYCTIHPYWHILQSWRSKLWPETSSISQLSLCEKPRLWRVCVYWHMRSLFRAFTAGICVDSPEHICSLVRYVLKSRALACSNVYNKFIKKF